MLEQDDLRFAERIEVMLRWEGRLHLTPPAATGSGLQLQRC
jgi:hypothetical protein